MITQGQVTVTEGRYSQDHNREAQFQPGRKLTLNWEIKAGLMEGVRQRAGP